MSETKAPAQMRSGKAFYDPLTELPNTALFADRLANALESALRGGHSPWVLVLDVNGIKAVNETFGHSAGDDVLLEAVRRIRSCLPDDSELARMGGVTFGVLLSGDAAPAPVELAERIRHSMTEPIRRGERELLIDASIGVAESPRGSIQGDAVIRNAEAAMYAAKGRAERGVEVYRAELHNDVVARFELITDLRQALEKEQFILHYQPIVHLEDERIIGIEALVRWMHPTRGLVPPGDFVPIAEETGMILHLDRWVLRHACDTVHSWHERGLNDPLSLSVNLSARQLQDTNLVRYVEETLRKTGLEPERLTLEITESILMQNMEIAVRVLHSLKSLGLRLAIDDFGIGFSSLSYLRQLPVDVVKIDRSFVAGIASASDEWTLARGIVKLVHGLGLETLAEGVERADQKAHLRALGCRSAQGFYFAKPMGADALRTLLHENKRKVASNAAPRNRRSGTEDVAERVADVAEEVSDLIGGVPGARES